MRRGERDGAARLPQAHNMRCWRAVRPPQAHRMCHWSPRREGEASAREKSSRISPTTQSSSNSKRRQGEEVEGELAARRRWRPGEGGCVP